MPNSTYEAMQQASVNSLEVLAKLLESDPDTIAALSRRQIDEGLKVMNICRKEVLPDAIKGLLSSADSEFTRKRRPRLYRPTGRTVLSAFVVFVILGLVKFFRSRTKLIPACTAFVIGCAVASCVTIGIFRKEAAAREKAWENQQAQVETNVTILKQEKDTVRHSYEKLRVRLEYLSALNREIAQAASRKTANGKEVINCSLSAKAHLDDLVGQAQVLTAPPQSEYTSRPCGVPVNGSVEGAITSSAGSSAVGLKFSIPPGTPISSTGDGIVIDDKAIPQYGKCLRVSHSDGVVTCYGPLSDISVVRGQPVKNGETIGYALTSARGSMVSFRYEVFKNSRPDSIMSYLKKEER